MSKKEQKFQLQTCNCDQPWEMEESGHCDHCGKIMKKAIGQRTNVNQGLLLLDKAIDLTRKKMRIEAEQRGMTIEEYIKYNRLPLEK